MCPLAASLALALAFSPVKQLEAELRGFPPPEVVGAYMQFVDAQFAWIELQMRTSPYMNNKTYHQLLERLITLGKLVDSWNLLERAQDTRRTVQERRSSLSRLQKSIGMEAYYSARMPFLPLRYFIEGTPPPFTPTPIGRKRA
jgi:hypothetical protein